MRRLFLVFTAFTLVIFGGVVMTPTAAHATPPTCTSTPTTWADLQIAMMNTGTSASPNVVCLGANLVGPADQNLRLGHLQYVVLDLSGYSLAISGGTAGAGIDTNVDGHLTIQDSNPGSNTLTATGGNGAAGIGGGNGGNGGTITINSGTIIATGAPSATSGAGIGGGNGGNGGMITINGGNISVTGGGYAAGIGGGNGGGNGGTITINSGNITSTGGFGAAGVGGGNGGNGGMITINGGTISATGGNLGAGIGGGWLGDGGTITINSGNITSTGGFGAAGVGGGNSGNGGTITINGGTISATSGNSGAGIGGGGGGTITISGGTISATGGFSGAGIGGSAGENGGTITISGGTISATGGDFGAGIGGGIDGDGGIIAIGGGNVSAMGGFSGAGIGGGGGNGNGGSITVTAGSVVATGGADAAGIGGGNGGDGGNVTLSGGRIQAIRWVRSSAEIGSGAGGSQGGSLTVTTVSPISWINLDTSGTSGHAPSSTSTTPSSSASAASVTRTEGYDYVTFTFNYAVSFNTGGGSSVIQQDVAYRQRPTLPAPPTRAGYAMDTWHTDSASGPTYNFSSGTTITAATTLYASWGMLDTTCSSENKPTSWAELIGSVSSATSSNTSSANPKVVCLGAIISVANMHLTLSSGAYVTLDLNGYSLFVTDADDNHAAIENTGAYLTIQDSHPGSNVLIVVGGANGAGIGGGNGATGGSLTINSGNVTTRGGAFAAGIGGGDGGMGGATTINGGQVNVIAGYSGAGIGGGNGGDGGATTINDGVITVTAAWYGAGIGGGAGYTVSANRGNGGVTTINGGVTTAVGGSRAAGIGGGNKGRGGITVINNGFVSATAGAYGAGIGGGENGRGEYITINGGIVNAMGGEFGAGIGDGAMPSAGLIALEINGGAVTATGGPYGAGIGSGYAATTCGNISISAGNVTATGGQVAAGIGAGFLGTGCNVTLSGGKTQAIATPGIVSGVPVSGAAIGSGYLPRSYSDAGTLTVVTLTSSPFTPIPNGSGTTGGFAPTTSSSTATNGAPARSVTKTEENGTVTFTFNYDVSFNSGSGSSVTQQEVGYGSRPDRPTDPTLAGYAMDTWHTGSASGPTYDFSTGSNITAATTLYASWNAINAAPLSINAVTRAVNITQTDRQVGSSWNVKVHSTPVTLGSGATDGSAAVIFSGTIPAVAAGVHRVEVSSTASNSVTEIQKLWFVSDQSDTIIGVYTTEAEANAAWDALQPSVARLSNTGLATARVFTTLTAGALLLLVGIAIVIWRRRRTY
ncbi:hypothetical protein M2118_001586 [Aurantimicrobium minutum]|nr:hypothetical protein [Aurantimicrobium minutum]